MYVGRRGCHLRRHREMVIKSFNEYLPLILIGSYFAVYKKYNCLRSETIATLKENGTIYQGKSDIVNILII